MWLPETAVDTDTLEELATQGIQFVIVAPRQAKAIRTASSKEWTQVNVESLDTGRPYAIHLRPVPKSQPSSMHPNPRRGSLSMAG